MSEEPMTSSDSQLSASDRTACSDASAAETIACLVCGRVSNTGNHYGVLACLGCKTFFRRVVLQEKPLRCKFKGRCQLENNPNVKRLCRRCRYERCLDIGMREQALHPKRDAIGSRKPANERPQLSEKSKFALKFLEDIVQMDEELRTKTALLLGTSQPHGNKKIYFYSPNCSYSNVSLNSEFLQSLRLDLAILRDWVSRVPRFLELTPHFRITLTRRFCFRYTVIEHGVYTAQMPSHENVWFLSDRTCLIRDFVDIPKEIRQNLTAKIVEEQRLLLPLTNMLIDEVALPLRRLKLRPIEVATLKVLMLLKPTFLFESYKSIATVEDLNIIFEVRNEVLHGLHAYYEQSAEENISERTGDVLMLLGGIEICAAQTVEEMHLLHFFNLSQFDQESQDVIFGISSKDTQNMVNSDHSHV